MEAPKIPRLFGTKTQKPRQFEFRPRYYNEKKEKMEKRYARIKAELNLENDDNKPKSQFRSNLRASWESQSKRRGNKGFNLRIIIYALVLLGLAYYILK